MTTIERTIDDRIELIASIKAVNSKINDIISDDFVLCKLSPKEKEFIIEMVNNAFLSRKIMNIIKLKGTNWEWNKELKKWEKKELTKEEKDTLDKLKETMFSTYMNKLYMISILSRNVPSNYLVEKITGIMDSQEEDDPNKLDDTRLNRMINRMKGKNKRERDEDYEDGN